MNPVLWELGMFICALQLGFPLLAHSIKMRFLRAGIRMESSALFSIFNASGFWSEASRLNKSVKDPVIRKLMLIYHVWWIALVGLILLIASGRFS